VFTSLLELHISLIGIFSWRLSGGARRRSPSCRFIVLAEHARTRTKRYCRARVWPYVGVAGVLAAAAPLGMPSIGEERTSPWLEAIPIIAGIRQQPYPRLGSKPVPAPRTRYEVRDMSPSGFHRRDRLKHTFPSASKCVRGGVCGASSQAGLLSLRLGQYF